MAREKDEERTQDGRVDVDCWIVVPPFLKYSAGPLLGPAVLEGAARQNGFCVRTVDLNIQYLRNSSPPENSDTEVCFFGDHAKTSSNLVACGQEFWKEMADAFEE